MTAGDGAGSRLTLPVPVVGFFPPMPPMDGGDFSSERIPMLVLSRKPSETIVINVPGYPHPIVVAVIRQVPGKTKIGIQAPPPT